MSSKVLAAGVLSIGLGFGATVACAQRQPETFFKNRIGLSDSDIQKMDQGQVVTKVLESGDKKYGILVFGGVYVNRSEEHTSELQSQSNLVCRLLLEKKKLSRRAQARSASRLVRAGRRTGP